MDAKLARVFKTHITRKSGIDSQVSVTKMFDVVHWYKFWSTKNKSLAICCMNCTAAQAERVSESIDSFNQIDYEVTQITEDSDRFGNIVIFYKIKRS